MPISFPFISPGLHAWPGNKKMLELVDIDHDYLHRHACSQTLYASVAVMAAAPAVPDATTYTDARTPLLT